VDLAQDLTKTEIHSRALRGNLHVLMGYGGNIAVSTGPDGTLLVDDEYAGLTPKVRTALAGLRSPPVKIVVNTHWHDDHTGGNAAFARDGALIIAQENARRRMRSDQVVSLLGTPRRHIRRSRGPRSPSISRCGCIGMAMRLMLSTGPAHTDGDAIVIFFVSRT